MKSEDQVKAIAELAGDMEPHTPTEAEIKSGTYYQFEPDYLTSRDAIIRAIEKWCGSDNQRWEQFCASLASVLNLGIGGSYTWIARWIVSATAEQLCETLLRATNKWKD